MEKPTSWVYFIQAATGDVKIGYAGNPRSRMADMQTAHSKPLKLLGAIPGDMTVERSLHKKFAHLRLMGEWFKPEPILMSFIEGACFGRDVTDSGGPDTAVAPITRTQAEAFAAYVRLESRVVAAEDLCLRLRGATEVSAPEKVHVAQAALELQESFMVSGGVVDLWGRARAEKAHDGIVAILAELDIRLADAYANENAEEWADPLPDADWPPVSGLEIN